MFAVAQAIFLNSAVFRLQSVMVVGNVHLKEDVVTAEAQLPMGAHLAAIRTHPVADRVRGLHWVKDAVVRRRLPGRVVIRIQERVPALAALQDDGDGDADAFPRHWFLVSEDGMVLAPAGKRGNERLPRVTLTSPLHVGSRIDARLVAAVLKFHANLPTALADQVTEMRADERGQLDLLLNLGNRPVQVRMGGPDKTRYKFQVLQVLVERLQQEGKPIAYIDLRYNDPAVGHVPHLGKSASHHGE